MERNISGEAEVRSMRMGMRLNPFYPIAVSALLLLAVSLLLVTPSFPQDKPETTPILLELKIAEKAAVWTINGESYSLDPATGELSHNGDVVTLSEKSLSNLRNMLQSVMVGLDDYDDNFNVVPDHPRKHSEPKDDTGTAGNSGESRKNPTSSHPPSG